MTEEMRFGIRLLWLVLSVAIVLFISFVGASALLTGDLTNFGFNTESGVPTKSAVNPAWLLGSLTVAGVVASLAVNVLRAQRQDEPVRIRNFLNGMLYPQTFIALCVSPAVFFGVLIALDGRDLGAPVFLAAFQNGFFWQRVLDRSG